MSIYTPPANNAVDFALSSFTPVNLTPVSNELTVYVPPTLTAVDFDLTEYTPPIGLYVGWELLPSAGVDYTLACNVGSYSYVGNDATLAYVPGAVNYTLACDAGAYAYTGQDAALTYVAGNVDYVLACDAGEYSYVGNNATLTYTQGVVNYDSHDGADTKRRDKQFKQEKEKLRKMLEEAFDVAQGVQLPQEIKQHKERVPVLVAKLTEQDIAEVKAEVNLLLSQIYMQAAIQKAAQDEDDVETLMLLNG